MSTMGLWSTLLVNWTRNALSTLYELGAAFPKWVEGLGDKELGARLGSRCGFKSSSSGEGTPLPRFAVNLGLDAFCARG